MAMDLGIVLDAVTDEWELGLTIATRAGISTRTSGQRLRALHRRSFVERTRAAQTKGRYLYRRGPRAPRRRSDADRYATELGLGTPPETTRLWSLLETDPVSQSDLGLALADVVLDAYRTARQFDIDLDAAIADRYRAVVAA